MFVRSIHFSMNGADPSAADAVYAKAKEMWIAQLGFHSIQRFRFAEGPHKDDQMVVLRFDSRESFDAAAEAIKPQRDEYMKALAAAGVKQEEIMMLDELQ